MDNNQQNPLLNPVVVDNLIQFISNPEDLRQVRLVCQLWNDRSFKKWRSMIATAKLSPGTEQRQRNVVGITNAPVAPVVESPSRWNTNWPIDDFLTQFQDPSDPCQLVKAPFKNIILSDIILELTPILDPMEDGDLPKFWNSVGPLVTNVTFKSCQFQGNRPEILERILTEKLTALQSLTLINCTTIPAKSQWNIDARNLRDLDLRSSTSIKTINVQGSPPVNFCRLLKITPNIEALTMNDNLIYPHVGPYRLIEFLDILFRLGPSFKHLDILDQFFFDHIMDMSTHWPRLTFPLEHFSLTITPNLPSLRTYGCDLDIQNMLAPAIRQFAGTLKVLKIFRPPLNQAARVSPFQNQMAALEELSLSGNITRCLDFLGKTPNLKMLHVDFRSYDNLDRMGKLFVGNRHRPLFAERYVPLEDRDIFNVGNGEEVRLEEMWKFHINLDIMPSSVPIIADWMPNLRCLEAVLLKDGFRAVCRGLPNLEELVLLHDSKVDDEALTEIGEGSGNQANITALERLKKFHLKQLCDAKKYRLGNKSVYDGFLKMTTLESVHICVADKMTAKAIADLKEHVADVKVTRIHVAKNVRNMECCKLSKFLELNNILL